MQDTFTRQLRLTRVEADHPAHRGNPHLVAVVADAGDHVAEQVEGMLDAGRHLVVRMVERPEEEGVEESDGLGSHAHDIAQDAAHPRLGAAHRVQGRGVVVGFHGHHVGPVVIEGHQARVLLDDQQVLRGLDSEDARLRMGQLDL